jgi:ribosomal protein S18 acetylase RimI-like enzyme
LTDGILAHPAGWTIDELAVALLSKAVAECRHNKPRLIQTLVPINTPPVQKWFEQVGFRPIAERVELACNTREQPAASVESPLTYESITHENRSRFKSVFEQTFIDSLDQAPDSYSGNLEQVWEAYRDAGVFRPEHWLITQHKSRDVGCLIVTDDPHSDYCEMTYLGIVPEFRGRAWGGLLVRQAQHLARAAGRNTLHVAVVAQNVPALKSYFREGFLEAARRIVMVEKID